MVEIEVVNYHEGDEVLLSDGRSATIIKFDSDDKTCCAWIKCDDTDESGWWLNVINLKPAAKSSYVLALEVLGDSYFE